MRIRTGEGVFWLFIQSLGELGDYSGERGVIFGKLNACTLFNEEMAPPRESQDSLSCI